MNFNLSKGVWPTMITPYQRDGGIDYEAVEKMVEWYITCGCVGIFAVCQSSEMFFLSEEEKVRLAKFIIGRVNGRIQVVASGHTADALPEQMIQMRKMAETGVDVVVLVSNRLAAENESEEIFKTNADKIFDALPDIRFGMYECPYPYKRLVTTDFLRYCAENRKMYFLKDTSCDSTILRQRIKAVKDKDLAIFNANTATLLESLRAGAAGYSGVMANFHPDMYNWLYQNYQNGNDRVTEVSEFLTVAAALESRAYPVSAKYHLAKTGIPMEYHSRSMNENRFDENAKREIDCLIGMESRIRQSLNASVNI